MNTFLVTLLEHRGPMGVAFVALAIYFWHRCGGPVPTWRQILQALRPTPTARIMWVGRDVESTDSVRSESLRRARDEVRQRAKALKLVASRMHDDDGGKAA